MTSPLLSPMLAALIPSLLAELREDPERFGHRVGTAIGAALPSAGGSVADYMDVAKALMAAAHLVGMAGADARHRIAARELRRGEQPRTIGLG